MRIKKVLNQNAVIVSTDNGKKKSPLERESGLIERKMIF